MLLTRSLSLYLSTPRMVSMVRCLASIDYRSFSVFLTIYILVLVIVTMFHDCRIFDQTSRFQHFISSQRLFLVRSAYMSCPGRPALHSAFSVVALYPAYTNNLRSRASS